MQLRTPDTQQMPFLKAICWQTQNIDHLTQDEIIDRYELGWNYLGVLEDLGPKERIFLQQLAKAKKSWIVNEL